MMEYINKAIWGSEPTPKERQQMMKRQMRKSLRTTDRDIQQQKRTLQTLKQQMTRVAKGKNLDKSAMTKLKIMAKEYLKMNKRLNNTELFKTTLESVSLKFDQQISMGVLNKNMKQSTGVMNDLQKFGNLSYLRNSVIELEKGMFQMGVKEEMLDDIMLTEDDLEDEEEEEEINKILSEIAPAYTSTEESAKDETVDENKQKLDDMKRMQKQVESSQHKIEISEKKDEVVAEEDMDNEVDNMIKEMRDKLKALQT